ncbi:TPR-like protein, partial [Thelephora ganbajun]
FSKQALYCYSKAYSLDPTNVDALWDRAILAKEIGQINTARTALCAILKQIPHDLNVLEELRPILIEGNKIDVCASLHQDAFEHHQELYSTGVGIDPGTGQEILGGGFGLMHTFVLADSYNSIKKYHDAYYWDACEDDREFDIVGSAVIRSGTVAPGMYKLDINARHRLAVARIKMGDIEEGRDVREFAPLFSETADAYYDKRMYTAAATIYEELGQDPTTSSMYVLERAAACRRMSGDLENSAAIYEQGSNDDAKRGLAEVYEILGETRKALNLVNQVIDARGRRGTRHGKPGKVASHPHVQGASLFEETPSSRSTKGYRSSKSSRPVARELEVEKEKGVLKGYRRVTDLTPEMKTGNEVVVKEWLLEAEKLIENFRETRRLFLSTRSLGFQGMFKTKRNTEENEDNMASRLQIETDRGKGTGSKKSGNLVDVFRGVSFDDWLQLTIEYSFLLIRRDQHGLADEVLRHMLFSNAYQNQRAQDTLRLALIACAIHARDYRAVVEHGRKVIFTYQFNNEPIRILLAALASGHHQLDAFVASAFQKAMLREVRFSDLASSHPEQIKWNSLKCRFFNSAATSKSEYDEEGEGEDDTSADPGQIQVDAPSLPEKPTPFSCTSYQSAICYLLQAYGNCPEDPAVCISLAIASLSRAMQRQADNRHHIIAQSLAFMSQYRKIGAPDPDGAQEVEYNFGRLFHQIGLFSHAARHYEKALEIAEKRGGGIPKGGGVEKEAAYNLSVIYVTTGASALARNLYRRWLSI